MKPMPPINQENAEPHEQYNPVPLALLGLVLALVIWAISYIASSSANGAAALGDRRDLDSLSAAVPAVDQAADGTAIYTTHCQACHQPNGQGLAGVFPPLAGSAWVLEDSAMLAQIILHGMTGPIDVLGITYNGAMPNFDGQLSDAEIAAVATHIRTEWGNGATALDTAAVGAARQASKDRTTPWQGSDELRQFILAQPR